MGATLYRGEPERAVGPDEAHDDTARPTLGVGEDELKAIDKKIKDIVIEAAKFAEDAPEPDPSELYTNVLVESY